MNLNGMALAQNDAAIEQARLLRESAPPVRAGVTADGTALPAPDATDGTDDSFGAQMILKSQERLRSFVVTAGASFAYTSNVALTRRAERHDVFGVVDAGIGWSRRIASELEANVAGHISMFRYDRTPSIDFENLGFGAGLSWAPRQLRNASLFARYDFTELLDSDGDQILMEHALTAGVQKIITLGRSHALNVGFSGTASFADPNAAQRQQIGAFLSYHLQLTRKLETSILYRPAVHFYTDSGRTDFNQIVSLNLRHRFNESADVNASFTYGMNRSDRSVFDYDVITSGAAVTLSIRF
ncbi:MAG TPA: hypothetical protein VF551_02145 [Chthoniobacterales bacterium]